jgi:hypothetical protein
MSNYLPRHLKKIEALGRRERDLLRVLRRNGGEEEILRAAEEVRAARGRILKVKRSRICPTGSSFAGTYDAINEEIALYESTAVAAIVAEFRLWLLDEAGDVGPSGFELKRITVDQYHRMIGEGFLADDDRVELFDGFLIARPTETPREAVARGLIDRRLCLALPDAWSYRPLCAITLADSEPEPHAAIVRGRPRDYLRRHPQAADVALVAEVAGTTLDQARGLRARIYARASLPIYWIVNVAEDCVEVHTDPFGSRETPYRSREIVGVDGTLPLILDDREVARIAARDILP